MGKAMNTSHKRTTIYFPPAVHRVLRLKAAETSQSISNLVSEAVSGALAEDLADLKAFKMRENEPVLSYEAALAELKRNGKI